MNDKQNIGRDRALALLSELARELDQAGLRLRILAIGGAAMAIAYRADRVTDDIDAEYAYVAQVDAIANRVGARHGLRNGWFNNKAQFAIPLLNTDPQHIPIIQVGSVEIAVGNPRFLLAMKIAASRTHKDKDDIVILCRELGINTVQQATAVFNEFYPLDAVSPRGRTLLGLLLRDDPDSTLVSASHARQAPPARIECSEWMPRANKMCNLPHGHRGKHRHLTK